MSNVSFEYLGIDLGTSFSYIRGVNVKGSGGNTTPQNENVKENYLIDDFTSDHP